MDDATTRVLATPETYDKKHGRDICVQVGMHRMEKVANVSIVRDCHIVTADELATVLCEYIDGKLARQNQREE